MVTFDSGAYGHYLSKTDCVSAGLPILKPYTKQVGVPNGGTSKALHVSRLPFSQLSTNAAQADSFHNFPHSLMSVGKICNDGIIPFSHRMVSPSTKK